MNPSIIVKVIGFEAYRFLRSPVMIVSAIFSGLIFGWMLSLLASSAQEIYAAANDNSTASLFVWSFLSGLTDNTIPQLLRNTPLMGSFYIIIIFFTPFFSMMLTCDQVASDMGTKHLRYILPRISRVELLTARALSAILFWFLLVSFYVVLALIIFSFSNVPTSFDANLSVALRMIVTLTFYGLPFIVLMTFFNTFMSNAFLVFLSGIGSLLILSIIASFVPLASSSLSFIEYITPTAFKFDLLSSQAGKMFNAIFFLLIYSLIFIFSATAIFRKKDL